MMVYDWDETKRKANLTKHGVDFAVAADLDWDSAFTLEDIRQDYAESRYVTIAPVNGRLHVMVWCWRGDMIRVISLRKANKRENDHYENQELY